MRLRKTDQASGRLSLQDRSYRSSACAEAATVSCQTIRISGRNSAVECQLPKLNVEGSNPFARSKRKALGHKDLGLVLCAAEKVYWSRKTE